MQRFTQLYVELDRLSDPSDKLRSLQRYFAEAPSADAAWALFFLSGQRLPRSVNAEDLRQWIAEEGSLPLWLIEESYDVVGDLGEALALLAPTSVESQDTPFYVIVNERLLPLKKLNDEEKHRIVTTTWKELTSEQCLVYHKLILGEFRVSVSRMLIARSLAEIAGVELSEMAYRVMGSWQPTEEDLARILHSESSDITRTYPFHLGHSLDASPEMLGEINEWQAEWKWGGIRVQLIRREDQVLIWSNKDELLTDRFPEIAESTQHFPNGTVLDGEVLARQIDKPRPFADLQRRIGRKNIDKKIRSEVPVILMISDLLEYNGEDIRGTSFQERRKLLEQLLDEIDQPLPFILSPTIDAASWEELAHHRAGSRERLVEGLMLKRKSSVYGDGQIKGDWWKWKVDPLAITAVLIYVQKSEDKNPSIASDYTFGVWSDPDENDERKLVPIAKTSIGLTASEIEMIDRFVRENTLEKFGPVRVVKPELVFELAFEGIERSTRHKAGLAVRHPRIVQWLEGKVSEDAGSLEAMRALVRSLES